MPHLGKASDLKHTCSMALIVVLSRYGFSFAPTLADQKILVDQRGREITCRLGADPVAANLERCNSTMTMINQFKGPLTPICEFPSPFRLPAEVVILFRSEYSKAPEWARTDSRAPELLKQSLLGNASISSPTLRAIMPR